MVFVLCFITICTSAEMNSHKTSRKRATNERNQTLGLCRRRPIRRTAAAAPRLRCWPMRRGCPPAESRGPCRSSPIPLCPAAAPRCRTVGLPEPAVHPNPKLPRATTVRACFTWTLKKQHARDWIYNFVCFPPKKTSENFGAFSFFFFFWKKKNAI